MSLSHGKRPCFFGRPMNVIKRVLVVCSIMVDCTEIAHFAASLARGMGSELFMLTVIYNPFGVKGLSLPMPSLQKDFDALLEKINKDAQTIINREKLQGIRVHHMVREGKPEKEVVAAVDEQQIDLLVLPAYHQTRLEYFLFSGFNKALLRRMPCSVLFYKREPIAVEEDELQEEKEEEKWPVPAEAQTFEKH